MMIKAGQILSFDKELEKYKKSKLAGINQKTGY